MDQIYSKDNRYYLMGIATIFILLFHFYTFADNCTTSIHKILKYIFIHGDAGVNIFFLLSAYGLCYSFTSNNIRIFYNRRFKRLLPMLLIYCVFHYIIYKDFIYPQSIWHTFAHITGISIFFNDHLQDWFIPTLIFVYIIFPFLFWFSIRLKKIGWFSCIIIITLILLCMIPVYDFGWQLKIPRLCMVIIGIMTYLYEKENMKYIYAIYGWSALLSFTSFIQGAYLAAPCATLLLSKSGHLLPLKKLFSFIGRHSLEIYLGQALCLWKFSFTDDNYYCLIPIMFVCVALSASVLWAIQHYFWLFINKKTNRIRLL